MYKWYITIYKRYVYIYMTIYIVDIYCRPFFFLNFNRFKPPSKQSQILDINLFQSFESFDILFIQSVSHLRHINFLKIWTSKILEERIITKWPFWLIVPLVSYHRPNSLATWTIHVHKKQLTHIIQSFIVLKK